MTAPAPRRALVFAAGRGERMGPLARDRAKPSLPFLGRPLLSRILDGLAEAGVEEVVANLHHQPESLAPLLRRAERRLRIHRSFETRLLGTSGGLSRVAHLFAGAPFLVVNGDTLATADLAAMARFHRRRGAEATLLGDPRPVPALAGERRLRVGAGGALEGLMPPGGGGDGSDRRDGPVFCGVWLLEPEALDRLSGGPGSLAADLLPGVAAAGTGAVFESEAPWFEIGAPGRYLEASLRALRSGAFPEPDGGPVAGSAVVHSEAVVEDSLVLERAEIRAGARVERSVVAAGETVPERAEVRDALFAFGRSVPL